MARYMSHRTRGRAAAALGALLSAACGNGDDLDPYASVDTDFEPIAIAPRPAQSSVDPPGDVAVDGEPDGAGENDGAGGGEPPALDRDGCATPTGVSGAPRSISEALILMNSLPKPVSLACFLQSLTRPLSLYMTSSGQSLQPSPGERSPRTFIVLEPLVMSIVFDGPAQAALELGYRTTESRSIKTEIHFPLQTDVTFANLFDAVVNGTLTKCGSCHTSELVTVNEDLPVDVFESDIIPPYDFLEVGLPSLRAEHERCDATSEPERCGLLSAIFDFGEVRAAPLGIMF